MLTLNSVCNILGQSRKLIFQPKQLVWDMYCGGSTHIYIFGHVILKKIADSAVFVEKVLTSERARAKRTQFCDHPRGKTCLIQIFK